MNVQVIPAHRRVDGSDLIWLVYLVFFFIEPIYQPSVHYWLECFGVALLFVGVYIAFLRYDDLRIRIALLGVMFLMGANLYSWNQGSPAFMIYAAALLPLTVSSAPLVLSLLVVAAAVLVSLGWHLHLPSFGYGINAAMILIAGGINIFSAQRLRSDSKLRMKQEEIEGLAAVAERERIARDLHDVLGHTLSVIALKSELAGRLLHGECAHGPDEAISRDVLHRARTEIGDIEGIARVALAEVREAIIGYRARGLGAEIEAARQTLATAGVTLHSEGDLQPTSLTAAEETVLALALREAVTNIVRHAQATECRLRVVRTDALHRLSIEDNGQHSSAREGNGLRGMRERVESLGGQLSLTRDGGTRLLIDLPLHAVAAI